MNEDILIDEIEEAQDEQEAQNSEISEENAIAGVENSSEADYAALIESDLAALRAAIPGLEGLSDISELENPVRYGALRDLGLGPEEAYRASTTKFSRERRDNRAHLRSSLPRAARAPEGSISYRELELARELFSGVSDAEIQRLYKKVTR